MTKKSRTSADLLGDKPKPGRRPGEGGRSAVATRDRLNAAQADLAEARAAKLRGTLVDREDVLAHWASIIVDVRQRMIALPSRLGAKLGLSRRQVADIDAEIRAVLAQLADSDGIGDARKR